MALLRQLYETQQKKGPVLSLLGLCFLQFFMLLLYTAASVLYLQCYVEIVELVEFATDYPETIMVPGTQL